MTTIQKTIMVPKDHRLHVDLDLPSDVPIGEAELTILVRPAQDSEHNNAEAMAVLKRIAERGGVRRGPDAAAWQQETRHDRPLPWRE